MSIAPATSASYHPRKISARVPSMKYAADVDLEGNYKCDLGTPSLTDEDAILDGTDIASAGSTTTFLDDETEAPFGRNVTVDLSGAGTPAVVVKGRDYLGTPMQETITGNGTTTVQGLKAFKWIDLISWAALAGETMDVGWGTKLGLPYKSISTVGAAVTEYSDDVVNATGPTFVAGLASGTAATATNADVRGTVIPNTTLDGAKRIVMVLRADTSNLHGNAQYYS